MKKNLHQKLEKMTREQLLDFIDMLSESSAIENTMQLLLCPTQKDINKAFRSFERWCESNAYGHPTVKKEDGLAEATYVLLYALSNCDPKTQAAKLYQMIHALHEIIDFCEPAYEICYDCKQQLHELLVSHPESYSEEDINRYREAIKELFD